MTGFDDDEDDTFASSQTVEEQDIERQWRDFFGELRTIIWYVILALGIPGNILSAIVWLRRHVASQSSSTIYLAALAVNDLVYLLLGLAFTLKTCKTYHNHAEDWLCRGLRCLIWSARYLEPLLLLSFSVTRLIAIRRPLQASSIRQWRGHGDLGRLGSSGGGGSCTAHCKVKYTSIYIALIVVTTSNALRHGSHSFTCKLHHACLYSPAAEHHRPLAGTHLPSHGGEKAESSWVVGYIQK